MREGERERERQRDGLMKTWKRQEMDLYSPLILRSVWLLEGKQMCLRAHGSLYSHTVIHRLADEYGTSPVRHISRLISHRETDIQSIRHFYTTLKDRGRGERWGWVTEKRGLRDRMRNVMKATEWQRENDRVRITWGGKLDVCGEFVFWCSYPPGLERCWK